MGEVRSAYRNLERISERRRPFLRFKHKWKDIFIMDLKEIEVGL